MDTNLIWAHSLFAILAAFRLTTLFTTDSLWNWPRKRWPVIPWHCALCMSVWAGAIATIFVAAVPWLNWPLGLSWLYLALLATKASPKGPPVKANFDAILLDLDGEVIPTDKGKDDTPITLKAAALRALTSPLPEDQGLAAEEAFKRLELARKINKGGEQEIDPADAVLIRNRAAKVWIIEISGQVYELLKG